MRPRSSAAAGSCSSSTASTATPWSTSTATSPGSARTGTRVLRADRPVPRFGADNEIRVECRTHLDSRWYSGAGIYRDVHLIVKNPAHIAPDGVRVTTPDIDTERAVVEVAVEVENVGPSRRPALDCAIVDAHGAAVATGVTRHAAARHARHRRRRALCVAARAVERRSPPVLRRARRSRDGDQVVDEDPSTFGIRSLAARPAARACGSTARS